MKTPRVHRGSMWVWHLLTCVLLRALTQVIALLPMQLSETVYSVLDVHCPTLLKCLNKHNVDIC